MSQKKTKDVTDYYTLSNYLPSTTQNKEKKEGEYCWQMYKHAGQFIVNQWN